MLSITVHTVGPIMGVPSLTLTNAVKKTCGNQLYHIPEGILCSFSLT